MLPKIIIHRPSPSALALIFILYLCACSGHSNALDQKKDNTNLNAISEGGNPEEVLQKLLKLAGSTAAADQKSLLEFLSNKDSLYKLDSREDHVRMPVQKLRLAQVYKSMASNDSMPMQATLTSLARSGKPENCDACDTLLIKALASVRPATQDVIKFWETHSAADSIQLKFTIDALCDNGSEPAVALLENRLLDAEIAPEQKIAWMHDAILRHRHNPLLLAGLERILTTSLPEALRPHLVESLFDYRPKEWFRSDREPPLPDARPLTPETKKLLRKIGVKTLEAVSLSEAQRRAVSSALAELK